MFSSNRKLLLQTFFIFLVIIETLLTQEIGCGECKSKITEGYQIINIKSSVSLSSNYKIRYNKKKVLTHTFKNPHNILFDVITVSDAKLLCEDKPHEENTFFPGFAWKICICPVCGSHHGWHFSPFLNHCQVEEKDLKTCMNRNSFYGLVTSNLISSHNEKIEL